MPYFVNRPASCNSENFAPFTLFVSGSRIIFVEVRKSAFSRLVLPNKVPEKSLRVVASKSHLSEETQAFIDEVAKSTKNIEQVSKGSSLKLVMVAEGSADIYPRLAPTMEWDTAAADAIVRESGKMTYQFENEEAVVYNKENLLNPWFIVR